MRKALITGLGAVRLLEAIRRSGIKTRFYRASSSGMFGASPPPQNEKTSFYPNLRNRPLRAHSTI